MSISSVVASSPSLTRFVMSRLPASVHRRRGDAYARGVLATSLRRTRAYSAFLIEHGFDPSSACWERFGELPMTSKHSYVDRYPLADRCIDGDLHRTYVIERSSGVSGGCYYWPRLPDQDAGLVAQVDMGFRMYYHIDTVPTLLISTLALGTWVGGTKMAQILRDVALSGKYPVTTITPGVNVDEIVQIVRDLAPAYDQVVMFGYPPFIKGVLDEGAARGIDWSALDVKLGTAGEGYAEEWRENVVRMLGKDPDRDLTTIIGGYGAADLGAAVAQEYPLTVLVRRLCARHPELCLDLFGEMTPPDLFQYNPGSAYVESSDGELVFTVDSAAPLVRYAIHDLGGVIPFEHVLGVLHAHGRDPHKLLADAGFSSEDVWHLPFLYCYGRADGTVTVGGLNVYPENIQAVLAEAGDRAITGYKMSVAAESLRIDLEHQDPDLGAYEARSLAKRYHRVLVEGLQRVNGEYRALLASTPRLALPVVQVHAAGHGPFAEDVGKLKRCYTLVGHREAA